jgi:hypothetical protein
MFTRYMMVPATTMKTTILKAIMYIQKIVLNYLFKIQLMYLIKNLHS